MRWKVLAIIAFLAIAGGAVAVSFGALTPSAASTTGLLTATAGVADVTDEVAATGTVASVESYATAFGTDPWVVGDTADSTTPADSGIAWHVTSIEVGVGDVVTAGQVLARADSSDLDAQIEDARRSAKSARLQVVEAEKALGDADGSAQVRQARIALYSARSARANAEAALDALVEQREKDMILAPVGGVVTDVGLVEGADAPSGAAITIESSTLVVSTSVVESDVASISVDQAATVTITALDQIVDGTVTSIAPSAEEGSTSGVVSFAVTVELDEVPEALRPGMSAEVTIVVASAQDVLTVPSRALSGSGDSYTVRVVAADGTVEVRPVTVGLVTDSLAEIQSGLAAGESVVTGSSSTDTLGPGGGGFQGGGPGGGFQVDGGGPGGGFIGPGQ